MSGVREATHEELKELYRERVLENMELKERVKELEEDIKEWEIVNESWEEINKNLAEQNKRYRETLEFYADKGTYEVVETLPPTDEYHQPIEPVFKTVPIIYYDKGKEARKALEGEE